MDFDRNDNFSGTLPPQGSQPQPPAPIYIPAQTAQPAKRRGWRIFFGVLLALSIMGNIFLFVTLFGAVALFATGHGGFLTEEVVRDSSARAKIAIISVEGVIHGGLADDVYRQLKTAGEDGNVLGAIRSGRRIRAFGAGYCRQGGGVPAHWRLPDCVYLWQ